MSTVSIVKCDTYEAAAVRRAVEATLAPLGGIGAFVEPNQRVLLKPNLLMPARPERALTTHPAVIEALVELVQEAGGEPFIAESPGGPLHTNIAMQRLYRDTGVREVAERTGVTLRYDATAIQAPTPEGLLLKRLDLLKTWQEADVVISLPKLKTHNLTLITGALKNLFGLVPGLIKSGYHSKLPDLDHFCDMLLDVVACVRPALTVMDGVLGMEGNGPSLGGSPRHIGALIASADPVALDAIACQIIGAAPDRLALFRAAKRRGWWPVEISVEGAAVEEVAVPNFRLPASKQAATGSGGRGVISRLRTQALVPLPVPQRERCTACRTCVRTCPRGAIEIVDKLAVVDYERCIRCYCCHEMCPEAAIDLKFTWMGRLLRWSGLLG